MGSSHKVENHIETSTPTNGTEGKSIPRTRYGKELPKEWIPLYNQPLRTPVRSLRIVSIGAGMSGLNLAYKIYREYDLIGKGIVSDLCIYEANNDIGGTWLVNTYPGVACDIPSHIYTFTFEPNPDWSAFYVTGPEILAYIKRTAEKYDLARGVKCGHRVEKAEFNERSGTWALQIRTENGSLVSDECDVLVSSRGFLSDWKWPDIAGLSTFNGRLCHSAAWNSDFDWSGQRVAVIGNGSSAIQVLPKLIDKADHVTNFIRRPTYITPGLGSAEIEGKTQYVYSEEEKRKFRDDPEALKKYRKKVQNTNNKAFSVYVKDSQEQKVAKKETTKMMKSKLNENETLSQKLIPDWEVGCRRATPGPGYLEAFTRHDVSLVKCGIQQIEESGIRTLDGNFYPMDAIVCATGFNVTHRPKWPLIGRDGITLAEAWKDEPVAYMSLCVDRFPNFFLFTGPNCPIGHGSFMAVLGICADYICQWIRKIAEEDILSVDVRSEAVKEFDAYSDEIMQTLVWSGSCHSWYKNNRTDGKVTAVWAGSALSFMEMTRQLRPEDFNIKYRSKNRFRFMGNGRTSLEYEPNADLAYYLVK